MSENEVLGIVEKMSNIPYEKLDMIFALYDRQKIGNESLGLIDIFNYGYMLGKREERAKRKAPR